MRLILILLLFTILHVSLVTIKDTCQMVRRLKKKADTTSTSTTDLYSTSVHKGIDHGGELKFKRHAYGNVEDQEQIEEHGHFKEYENVEDQGHIEEYGNVEDQGNIEEFQDDERHQRYHHHRLSSHFLKRFKRAWGATEVNNLTVFGMSFFVHVQYEKTNADGKIKDVNCGGALLSRSWVVTAAHCLFPLDKIDVRSISIIAGTSNLTDPPAENIFNVERYEYITEGTYKFEMDGERGDLRVVDLVLLNLVTTTRLLSDVVPILLGEYYHNENVCVIGRDQSTREFLRVFSAVTYRKNDRQTSSLVKVASPLEYGLCFGDSGSPVVSYNRKKKQFVLEGVFSFTEHTVRDDRKCPRSDPGWNVFVMTAPYLDRIREILDERKPDWTPPTDFSLPFRMTLGVLIEFGNSLVVSGKFHETASQFEVNFLSTLRMSSTVPEASRFHLKFRFDKRIVVANQMKNYEWDHDTEVVRENPCIRGEPFELRLTVYTTGVLVRMNGSEILFYEFVRTSTYHDEFIHSEHLEIDGDADVTNINFGGSMFPIPHTITFSDSNEKMIFGYNSFLEFYAVPSGNWKIRLLGVNPHDVFFSASIIFSESWIDNSNGEIVRSGPPREGMETEERGGEFPFRLRVGGNVRIENSRENIKILVNNRTIFTFVHRVSDVKTEYKRFEIDGKVKIMDVHFHGEVPPPPKYRRRRREHLRRRRELRKKKLLRKQQELQ